MNTLRLPLYLVFALLGALSFTACIEDDPIVIDEPPTPPPVEEFELRVDGDNFTAPQLPAGVHRFAVRFSERQLLDFDGRELVGMSVFMAPGATPEYLDLRVFGQGDAQPEDELALVTVDNLPRDLGRFIEYTFEEPVVIDAESPLWLEAEVRLPTSQQTIGCDRPGSGVAGGDWLWSEDRWLPFSERTSENVNWNIRGIVE